ncbi:MAG: hypothetical protein JHC93_01695 [Parachlamydiales bacterium]|nr:hypothetical protein [Parachlamydiales bacterium]
MKLLTFSTELEAKSTIDIFKAQSLNHNLYEFDSGHLLITGIGTYNAMSALLKQLHQNTYQYIWNLGIAGSFKNSILGELLPIQSIDKNISHPLQTDHSLDFAKTAHPTLCIKDGGAKLLTSDFPIHWKDQCLSDYDCVDMEGYGIAHAAKVAGIPLQMDKFISDFTNEEGPQMIREKMEYLSQCMAKHLLSDLD